MNYKFTKQVSITLYSRTNNTLYLRERLWQSKAINMKYDLSNREDISKANTNNIYPRERTIICTILLWQCNTLYLRERLWQSKAINMKYDLSNREDISKANTNNIYPRERTIICTILLWQCNTLYLRERLWQNKTIPFIWERSEGHHIGTSDFIYLRVRATI